MCSLPNTNVTVGANDIQTAPCIGRSTLLMLGETKIYLTKNTRRLNLHSLNRTCILCRKPYQKGAFYCDVMLWLYYTAWWVSENNIEITLLTRHLRACQGGNSSQQMSNPYFSMHIVVKTHHFYVNSVNKKHTANRKSNIFRLGVDTYWRPDAYKIHRGYNRFIIDKPFTCSTAIHWESMDV